MADVCAGKDALSNVKSPTKRPCLHEAPPHHARPGASEAAARAFPYDESSPDDVSNACVHLYAKQGDGGATAQRTRQLGITLANYFSVPRNRPTGPGQPDGSLLTAPSLEAEAKRWVHGRRAAVCGTASTHACMSHARATPCMRTMRAHELPPLPQLLLHALAPLTAFAAACRLLPLPPLQLREVATCKFTGT